MEKVHKGCLWSVAIGHQMEQLSKVRNINYVCLLSPWKKSSGLFNVCSEVSTCLSLLSLNDTSSRTWKNGWNGEIFFFIWFDSYMIRSLQDEFLSFWVVAVLGFYFFVWVGVFLAMLFDSNTVISNDPILLSLLVLTESRLGAADKPSLLCLSSAWAEQADCKPDCAWKLPNCVQAIPAWASNPWTCRFAGSFGWFHRVDMLTVLFCRTHLYFTTQTSILTKLWGAVIELLLFHQGGRHHDVAWQCLCDRTRSWSKISHGVLNSCHIMGYQEKFHWIKRNYFSSKYLEQAEKWGMRS